MSHKSESSGELSVGTDNTEMEIFPVEPRYHPIHKLPRIIFDFLASAKLAMALLVICLVCCFVGVTVFRGAKAWEVIFNTVWFNGILVLLVINVACCFFGRIWGRRITWVSFGMILFHLSFVTMFLGIVYNSLFYFRANLRLSEGEVLTNSDPNSYDVFTKGRFFSFDRLKGETTLIEVHRDFKVDGKDKRVAYEVGVGQGGFKKKGLIYLTHNLDYRGFTYFPDREGYSLLTVLYDKSGKEVYGGVIPLQSLKQKNKDLLIVTGTREGAAGVEYPQINMAPLYDLQMRYFPSKLNYRGGEVEFEVRELPNSDGKRQERPFVIGKVPVGQKINVGNYDMAVKDVRYWVMMKVVYEPGKLVVLASLWVALAGVIITTVARIFRYKS